MPCMTSSWILVLLGMGHSTLYAYEWDTLHRWTIIGTHSWFCQGVGHSPLYTQLVHSNLYACEWGTLPHITRTGAL